MIFFYLVWHIPFIVNIRLDSANPCTFCPCLCFYDLVWILYFFSLLCVLLLGKVYILPIAGQRHYIYYPIHRDWDWSRRDFKKALICLKTMFVTMFSTETCILCSNKKSGFTNCRPSKWEPRKREFYVNVAFILCYCGASHSAQPKTALLLNGHSML